MDPQSIEPDNNLSESDRNRRNFRDLAGRISRAMGNHPIFSDFNLATEEGEPRERRDRERDQEDVEQGNNTQNSQDGELRMRLDITRESQTLYDFFQNFLPFLAIFALKLIYDHLFDICLLLVLASFFVQADHHVKKILSGEFANKCLQISYTLTYSTLVILFLLYSEIPDFKFSNVFGLRLEYFISAENSNAIGMSATFYGIICLDTLFKLITVMPKLFIAISSESFIPAHRKRRLLQWTEYCSQLYRCALPFGPWARYFLYSGSNEGSFSTVLATLYLFLKIREIYRYSMSVRKAIRYLFSESTFGTTPSSWEMNSDPCTICHDDIKQPTKLECNHIFCRTCIERWLDGSTTCPICRAVVAKDVDNDWKNGGTSRAIRFF